MKIGSCCGMERIDLVEGLGYEQIEFSVSYISTLDAQGIAEMKQLVEGRKIVLRSCNGMFPGDIPRLHEDEGLVATRAYLERAMANLEELGVTTAVFGSGGYRRMPEEIPPQRQHQLLRDVLELMEGIARKHNVTVVIEPLNRAETNVLNTTAEAMEYIRELELPNLKLLVDLYHFYREEEPISRIYEYGPYIRHVHIAEPTRRDFLSAEDTYDYTPFFQALKDIDYRGAVMFEGGKGDFDSGIAQTYPVLKALAK